MSHVNRKTGRPSPVLFQLAVIVHLTAAAALLAGCAPSATVRGSGAPGMGAAKLEPYDGPKARIAVAQFDDRTAKGYGEIGEGMATMFTTALVNSNRYIVLERDLIHEVIREQDLGSSGRVAAATAAPTGEIEGAELLLTGAVTEFEPEKMGLGGGIIGLGTLVGTAVLHANDSNIPIAAATYLTSHIALDVRLVDTATGRVLAAASVEGSGEDWGGGIIGEVGGGRSRLPLAFGGFQKTATEKAVRTAVDTAVFELVRQTPPQFFHYTDDVYAAGRIVGFGFLDLAGVESAAFTARGVTVAASPGEWSVLAGRLGLAGKAAEPPVDFASRQVAVVAAGTQSEAGRSVSVEKAVAFPGRIELTASLLPPPAPAGGEKKASAPTPTRTPLAVVSLEKVPGEVTVKWTSP